MAWLSSKLTLERAEKLRIGISWIIKSKIKFKTYYKIEVRTLKKKHQADWKFGLIQIQCPKNTTDTYTHTITFPPLNLCSVKSWDLKFVENLPQIHSSSSIFILIQFIENVLPGTSSKISHGTQNPYKLVVVIGEGISINQKLNYFTCDRQR